MGNEILVSQSAFKVGKPPLQVACTCGGSITVRSKTTRITCEKCQTSHAITVVANVKFKGVREEGGTFVDRPVRGYDPDDPG